MMGIVLWAFALLYGVRQLVLLELSGIKDLEEVDNIFSRESVSVTLYLSS